MTREIDAICGLLKGSDPELRCAAARVLGALEPDEDRVVGALAKAAADENGMVRKYAVDALAKVAKARHVPDLLPLLEGPARERILPLVTQLGGNPMSALKKGLDDPAKRLASAQSIANLGGLRAFEALLKETSDADLEYVKSVTNLIRGVVDMLADADREKAFESAKKALEGAKERVAKVAAVRVIGYLRLRDGAELLAKLTAASEHPSVRSHAIHALAALNYGEKKVPVSLVRTLAALLDDNDRPNVVEPALAALGRVSLPEDFDLDPLLANPWPPVRVFAMKVFGGRGDRESGRKLIEALEDRDEGVREEAMAALRREPKFGAMLAGFLEKGEKGDREEVFASILKGYHGGFPPEMAKKFLKKGLEAFEKDGSTDWALEVAKSGAAAEYRRELFDRGVRFRKAKKLELAERFLGQLQRDNLADDETRYELAVLRLRSNPKLAQLSERSRSYALTVLGQMAKADAKGLAKRLKKEAGFLTHAEYAYLGHHCADTPGLESFGADMLKIVAKSSSKEAAAAKERLKALKGSS